MRGFFAARSVFAKESIASSYGISFMEPSGWRWRGSFGRVGSFAWWNRLVPMMQALCASRILVSSSETSTSISSQDEPQYGHPTPLISFGIITDLLSRDLLH